jgi:hypothetical protein
VFSARAGIIKPAGTVIGPFGFVFISSKSCVQENTRKHERNDGIIYLFIFIVYKG